MEHNSSSLPKKSKMKVGLIYYKYPIYDGGSHITDLVNNIAERVEKVVLISTHSPKVDFVKPKNLSLLWIPSFKLPWLDGLYFTFMSLFHMLLSKDLREVDIINVICARGIIPAYAYSKICNKRLFCTIELINNPTLGGKDKIAYWFQKAMYTIPRFTKIICWSKYHYQKYLTAWGIKETDIAYIPNGINVNQYSPLVSGEEIRKKILKHEFLIVFAKPLYSYNKEAAKLLVKILPKLRHDVQLVLGMGPYKRELDVLISELNMSAKVTYMPNVPMTDIPNYLAASDIIVLPYLYEATVSRSLIEAMAMAKPIIVSGLGEPPLILENNQSAIICEPEANTLARAVDLLLADPNLRKRLGNNARNKCLKDYNILSVAQNTVKLYESI